MKVHDVNVARWWQWCHLTPPRLHRIVNQCPSLVLSCVLVPLPLHSHTRMRIAVLKNLATVGAPWRRPSIKKYTNQCINNVGQTFACRLLFNKNPSLFMKMTYNAIYGAENARHREWNCVESIQLGRHSAGSQNWTFPRQKFRIAFKDKLSAAILSNSIWKLLRFDLTKMLYAGLFKMIWLRNLA